MELVRVSFPASRPIVVPVELKMVVTVVVYPGAIVTIYIPFASAFAPIVTKRKRSVPVAVRVSTPFAGIEYCANPFVSIAGKLLTFIVSVFAIPHGWVHPLLSNLDYKSITACRGLPGNIGDSCPTIISFKNNI